MPSSAENYHQATKYSPTTIGEHPGLDWHSKPPLCKDYPGTPLVEATDPEFLSFEAASLAQLSLVNSLMRMLYCLYGPTAMVETAEGIMMLRAAPSAGGLYPAEIYVLVREIDEVSSGIYNYHVEKNALQQVYAFGSAEEEEAAVNAVARACGGEERFADASLIFFFTALYFRASWRYLERGYRRCLLDTGHLIGNFRMVLEIEDLVSGITSGFVDDELNALLGLRGQEEGVLAVGYVYGPERAVEAKPDSIRGALRSSAFAPEIVPDPEEAQRMAIRETAIARSDLPLALASDVGAAQFGLSQANYRFGKGYTDESEAEFGEDILHAILQRRSGRQYSGEPITFRQLMTVLKFAYAPDSAGIERGAFAPELLDSWLVVHNVQGLSPGIYAWDATEQTLYLVEEGDFRVELSYISLGQEIAARSSAVLIHTANLAHVVQRFGNRGYRTLHLDAGQIGQRLAVASEALGFSTCGVGGFFDDQVNALLSLGASDICVYLTTIGRE